MRNLITLALLLVALGAIAGAASANVNGPIEIFGGGIRPTAVVP